VSALYVVASVATAAKLQREWFGHDARVWESNVQSSLGALTRSGQTVVVTNNVVPQYIVVLEPLSLSTIAGVIPHYVGPGVHVDGALTGRLVTLAPRGRAHPATIGPSVALTQAAPGRCLGSAGADNNLQLVIPSPPPSSGDYYVVFRYAAQRTMSARLLVDDGRGLAPAPTPFVAMARGRHSSLGWLGIGSPRRLALSIPSGGACVDRIEAVSVLPAA
jgi:hypothetical protein